MTRNRIETYLQISLYISKKELSIKKVTMKIATIAKNLKSHAPSDYKLRFKIPENLPPGSERISIKTKNKAKAKLSR